LTGITEAVESNVRIVYESRRIPATVERVAASRASQNPYKDVRTAPYRLFAFLAILSVAGVSGSGRRSFLVIELDLIIVFSKIGVRDK
jgi:hypothetical protein